jgi:hypothetical protein
MGGKGTKERRKRSTTEMGEGRNKGERGGGENKEVPILYNSNLRWARRGIKEGGGGKGAKLRGDKR